jgi:serine/threonine protein phosphatase PrpC
LRIRGHGPPRVGERLRKMQLVSLVGVCFPCDTDNDDECSDNLFLLPAVLHEIHNTEDRSVLVAGIMDGHGGTAASTMVAEQLPNILNTELVTNRLGVTEALEHAWGQVCNSYRQQCSTSTTDGGEEECRADYDPASGILMANTGSDDLIAGTTASIVAVDEHTGKLTFLNCGDSRCVLVNNNNNKLGKGVVQFATRDHKPQEEEERFQKGKDDGLGYSLPQCSVSRWSISVGDYEYSTSRSLEGPFATSKGIISDPDVTTVQAEAGMIVVSASDGLWDVMDSSEVAMELFEMRHQKKMSARDAARALCNMAWNKGTSDNVSAVVVYL